MEPINGKIKLRSGDIFKSNVQTITNTINCVGVMGAGLALQFKKKFPEMYLDYKEKAKNDELKIGKPYLWKPKNSNDFWILNFPTKIHWKNDSRLEWIEMGLKYFKKNYKHWNITSIAFPALGSDLGRLKWEEVKECMIDNLSEVDIKIEIYEPYKKFVPIPNS